LVALIPLAVFSLSACNTAREAAAEPEVPVELPAGYVGVSFLVEATSQRLTKVGYTDFGTNDSGAKVVYGVQNTPLIKAVDNYLLIQLYGSSSCPPIIDAQLASSLELSVVVDDEYYVNTRCTADLAPHAFRLLPIDIVTQEPSENPELMHDIENTGGAVWFTSQTDGDGTFLAGSAKHFVTADDVFTPTASLGD